MQKIYDLVYQLSRSLKSRFGYALTIKQAVLTAYFAFLVGVFVELTGVVGLAYSGLHDAFPVAGGQAVYAFPSPAVISGGVTAYIGILIFKKVTNYVHAAWQSWIKTTHM